jgi:hypothetical protein
MSAVRRLSRDDLEKRLAHYGCRHVCDVCEGVELWETGWGEPFTLMPEDGFYDHFDYTRAVVLAGKTMPPSWQLKNGGR